MRDQKEIDVTASRKFARAFYTAFLTAALIGLILGAIWVISGILHFHPLW